MSVNPEHRSIVAGRWRRLVLFPAVAAPLLLVLACSGTQERGWEGVRITGSLVDEGGDPVSDGYVYAYGVLEGGTLGPADAMSEPSGRDGTYELIVPEGSWILVARKRRSRSISGPLRSGDMTGQMTEPVRARSGGRSGVDIRMRTFRSGAQSDPKRVLTTGTRIKGVVTDGEGRPLEGAHVFAYDGPFRQDPPDYLAPSTGPDGRFEISLPGGGSYTLGARTGQKGKPRPGDSLGFWGGERLPREIEKGSVTEGVRIVVEVYGDGD